MNMHDDTCSLIDNFTTKSILGRHIDNFLCLNCCRHTTWFTQHSLSLIITIFIYLEIRFHRSILKCKLFPILT